MFSRILTYGCGIVAAVQDYDIIVAPTFDLLQEFFPRLSAEYLGAKLAIDSIPTNRACRNCGE